MEKKTLTVKEAAEVLNVHPLTLRKSISRGQLRAVRIGRRVLVPMTVLDDFLSSRPSATSG